MPTIPIIPGNAGGAGIGNFNRAKTKPTRAPVINDNKINFMYVPPYSNELPNLSLINMARSLYNIRIYIEFTLLGNIHL
jgi:hypothetical protein